MKLRLSYAPKAAACGALLALLAGCQTEQHYSLAEVDRRPEPITMVSPEYPDELRALGVAGTVVVDFIVGSDGRVHRPFVVRSPDLRLSRIVLEGMKQWRFQPAVRHGVAAAARMQVPVEFGLAQEDANKIAGQDLIAGRQRTVPEHIQAGNQARAAGNLSLALAHYTAALHGNPGDPDARIARAGTYLDQRDYPAAIEDTTLLLEASPELGKARYLRASARIKQRDYAGAVSDIEELIERRQTDRFWTGTLVRELNLASRWTDALRIGERLLRDSPLDAERSQLHTECGIAYTALRRWQDAVISFDDSLALKPNDARTLGLRADALVHLGQGDTALRDADEALRLAPGGRTGLIARTKALFLMGRFNEAIDGARRATSGPDGSARKFGALMQEMMDARVRDGAIVADQVEFDRALGEADAWIKEAGPRPVDQAWAYGYRSRLHRELKNYGAAYDDLNQAIVLNDREAVFWELRGQTSERMNHWQEALRDYTRAQELAATSSTAVGIARSHARMGEWAKAAASLRAATELIAVTKPSHAYLHLYAAALGARSGDDSALTRLRGTMSTWYAGWPLTLARFVSGEISEATLLGEVDAAPTPDERIDRRYEAFYFVGVACRRNGETERAREYFTRCLAEPRPTSYEHGFARIELGLPEPDTLR